VLYTTMATGNQDIDDRNNGVDDSTLSTTGAFDPFSDDQAVSHQNNEANINHSFDDESGMVHLMSALNVENDGFQDEQSGFCNQVTSSATGSRNINTPSKAVRTPTSSRNCLPNAPSQVFQAWIVLREEINCVFNHFTKKYGTHTEGSIEVWMDASIPAILPFNFELTDKKRYVMEMKSADINIANSFDPNPADTGSKYALKVSIPKTEYQVGSKSLLIASYKCYSRGPEIPILLDKKISRAGSLCRVLINISPAPGSEFLSSLHGFVVVVAVPFAADGDSLKMPSPRGRFDAIRRTITWRIPCLPEEGQTPLKLLAQFNLAVDDCEDEILKFPLMVSCQGEGLEALPSGVDIDLLEAPSDVVIKLSRQLRMIHRVM